MDCFEERRQVLLQELAALSGEGALYGFLMRQGEQLPPFAEEWKRKPASCGDASTGYGCGWSLQAVWCGLMPIAIPSSAEV